MYKLVNEQTGKIIAMANSKLALIPIYRLCFDGEYSIERIKNERTNTRTETQAA